VYWPSLVNMQQQTNPHQSTYVATTYKQFNSNCSIDQHHCMYRAAFRLQAVLIIYVARLTYMQGRIKVVGTCATNRLGAPSEVYKTWWPFYSSLLILLSTRVSSSFYTLKLSTFLFGNNPLIRSSDTARHVANTEIRICRGEPQMAGAPCHGAICTMVNSAVHICFIDLEQSARAMGWRCHLRHNSTSPAYRWTISRCWHFDWYVSTGIQLYQSETNAELAKLPESLKIHCFLNNGVSTCGQVYRWTRSHQKPTIVKGNRWTPNHRISRIFNSR
jgi:hypothetical protein